MDQRAEEYRRYWEAAAAVLGGALVPISNEIWEVRVGGRCARIAGHVVGLDDPVTLRVAGDKPLCLRLASQEGVPVPEHLAFTLSELPSAIRFLQSSPGLCVVKPAYGSASGLGITTHVRTAAQARRAAALASLFGDRLLIEHMIPGESYRLLFLDGRLVHAVRRTGMRVRGDGSSSVRGLARAAGVNRLDVATDLLLAAQRLNPDSVPEAERAVLLRAVAPTATRTREMRTVYDAPAVGLLCAEVVEAAARLVRRVGSRFAGVDLVTCDPSVPLGECGGAVLEINTTPGIHHHYHTEEDRRLHPVAVAVLRSLLRRPTDRPDPIAPRVLREAAPSLIPSPGRGDSYELD